MNTKLEQQLIHHEGLRLMPYRCTAGALTIGVGRNLDAKGIRPFEIRDVFSGVQPNLSKGITKQQALALLASDIQDARRDVKTLLPHVESMPAQIQNVLVDMAFNLGRVRLSKFVTTLKLFAEGNYPEASRQMLKSRWASQVGNRAIRLAAMTMFVKYYDEVTHEMFESMKTGKPIKSVIVLIEQETPSHVEPVKITPPEYIPNESISQKILKYVLSLFK